MNDWRKYAWNHWLHLTLLDSVWSPDAVGASEDQRTEDRLPEAEPGVLREPLRRAPIGAVEGFRVSGSGLGVVPCDTEPICEDEGLLDARCVGEGDEVTMGTGLIPG